MSKRSPRLGPPNAFEQGWIDHLVNSDMDGFSPQDACIYLSTLRNHAGRRYQRIPHQGRMNAILKKSGVFMRREDNLWWRLGGDS